MLDIRLKDFHIRAFNVHGEQTEKNLSNSTLRETPLGFCLKVIVNEKPINLEKTTSIMSYLLLLIDLLNSSSKFTIPYVKKR